MASKQLSSIRKWLLSSPPAEWALTQLRELLIGAMKQGRIPKHVAFVMDGNRRYAKSHRIETVEGHNLGFEALARILEVCYKSGVTHVSIYAFSIENFKRSKAEVNALMEMARIKLNQLSQHGELLDRYGARIRILGQRELIRPDVLEAVDRAVALTAHNTKAVLNVCFPYTSRDEITTAIRSTVQEYSKPIPQAMSDGSRRSPFREEHIKSTILSQQKPESTSPHKEEAQPTSLTSPSSSTTSLSSASAPQSEQDSSEQNDNSSVSSATTLHPELTPSLQLLSPNTKPQIRQVVRSSPQSPHSTPIAYPSPELITPETLNAHMFTAEDPPLDILIRTSGVERLSDFMLWQCHQNTRIFFLDVLWPEFDLWSFLPVMWEWQWMMRKQEESEALEERASVRTKSNREDNVISGLNGLKVA